ncbi:hypothetical protein LINGRAHAP2_LOCUS8480 [Linum grandiflorum]
MRPLFFSSKSFVFVNGKFIFPTFTVKQIILQIVWLILTILSLMRCTFFIY